MVEGIEATEAVVSEDTARIGWLIRSGWIPLGESSA